MIPKDQKNMGKRNKINTGQLFTAAYKSGNKVIPQ
jgi:hypothetical protein